MATYLVDINNGSDTNDGISRPWKTLAKVNSRTFLPNDQVLLRCGGVWHEKLAVPSSGLTSAPILFSAYGSGPHPVIDRGSAGYPGVQVLGKSDVVLKYLDVRNTTNVAIWVRDGNRVRIEGCNLKNTKAHAIAVDGYSPSCTVYNNSLTLDPTFAMVGSFISFNTTASGANISTNRAILNGQLGNSNGIFVLDAVAPLVHHNTITGATVGIGINALTHDVRGAQVYLNAVYQTDGSHGDGEAIEFTGTPLLTVSGLIGHNLVQGGVRATGGIDGVYTKDCSIWGNIVLGWMSTCYHWTSDCLNTKLYNNVAYDCSYGFLLDPNCSGEIKNNLVMGCTSRGIGASAGMVVEDYNQFWKCGANNIPLGTHSLASDPRIIHYPPAGPNDCKLQDGSPCAGAGLRLVDLYQEGFDPSGASFPYPLLKPVAAWSRGAFVR